MRSARLSCFLGWSRTHVPLTRAATPFEPGSIHNTYNSYNEGRSHEACPFNGAQYASPVESGKRLKRIANRHGWTPSEASARLVEEGLRRSEFAFLDFHDSAAGRQAYIQGSTLAVWEVVLLLPSTTRKRFQRRSMKRSPTTIQRASKR